jgi:peptidase E
MTVGMLLGPQRLHPIVGEALEMLGVADNGSKIAAITAGWQEREAEDQELNAALGNRTVNLMLHARGEAVFREDPDFFAAHRAKQDRLRHLQELYRLRLASALKAARRVQQATAPRDLIEAELEEALQALRLLDAHHITKVRHIEEEFDRKVRPLERPALRRHLAEIDAILKHCSAVAIAGGHVAVLYNRMRLFDLRARLLARPTVPIMAWSAGAMVVSDRIVLFHDSPPQGRGNAEMLGAGLGLFPGVVVLPHASRRLMLHNHARISVFARRFASAVCVALDDRCWLRFDGARWSSGPDTYQLCSDGELVGNSAAAPVHPGLSLTGTATHPGTAARA